MSQILVLFASLHGQTRRIAERIGAGLARAGHAVSIQAADSPGAGAAIARSDAVIVGGALRAGSHGRALERLVKAHRAELDRRPGAFFSVSLSASGKPEQRAAAERCARKFCERTGWSPRFTTVFGGALVYSRYNFLLRFVMRRIVAAAGGDTDTSRDYEYTDWKAVDEFAAQLARALATPHALAA